MRPRLVVLAVVLALTSTACRSGDTSTIETAAVGPSTVVQHIAAPARIAPIDQRTVSATLGGTVTAVHVVDGAAVAAGDPVLSLASDQVDIAIAQAGAATDAAGALAGLSAATDLSPIVALLRGQLESTVPPLLDVLEAQAREIQNPERRQQTLDAIATARLSYEDSRRQLLEAEHEAAATSQRSVAAQRAAAAAQQRQAQVALDAARAQLDGLTLTAPISGVVEFGSTGAGAGSALSALGGSSGFGDLLGGSATSTSGPIAVGAELAPGQTLFTVYDVSSFHAAAEVDEVDVALLRDGQPALVLVDAFPDGVFDGSVDHIAVAPQRGETGGIAYPVRVHLQPLPEGIDLRVGLTASVEIEVRRIEAALTVPSSALLRRDGRETVLVVRAGVAVAVPVVVTAIGEDTAAVEPVEDAGLAVGDRVITRGAEDLDDGDAVS